VLKAIPRIVILRIAFYAGFAIFVVAVNAELRHLGQIPFTFAAPVEPSTARDQVTIITTMGSIIISLSTALFGALGFLFVNGPKANRGLWPKTIAVASGVSAAVSVYFGYLLYQAVMEMGSLQINFPNFPAITWARQCQFIAFMLAVVFFGDFAIDTFFLEDKGAS
jgi:hypothetical protein